MERLIDPKTLARVKDLSLLAKSVAEGFLYGLQQSAMRGIGMEFSQYRSYEPGDALSRIDWKLFARSDRYFVREAEKESETNLFLLVDATGSMAVQSERGAWSKLDYARSLAATLAYIGQRQGDNISLLGLSSESLHFVPPGKGQYHYQRILSGLNRLKSGDYFPKAQWLQQYLSKLQRPGLVMVLSDFYQQDNELMDFVKTISSGKTEVAAIELMSADEREFPYKGSVRFKDLETGEEVLTPAKQIKDDYFNALYEHQVALKAALAQSGVALNSINIDEPMDKALYHYLKCRQKVR